MSYYKLFQQAQIKASLLYAIDGATLNHFDNTGKDAHLTSINARYLEKKPKVDTEGFTLFEHDFELQFTTDDDVLQQYYQNLSVFLKSKLNAIDVITLGHVFRAENSLAENAKAKRPPAAVVHSDYNAIRIKKLGNEADPFVVNNPNATNEALNKFLHKHKTWALFNLWFPLCTIINRPLALCDVRTVKSKDIISNLKFQNTANPNEATAGNLLSLTYSNEYRWLYYPLMQSNEALLFQQYESSQGLEQFIPVFHSGFYVLENANIQNAPRESAEFRFIVGY